jgi:predicted MFS family arabinose efflux permease
MGWIYLPTMRSHFTTKKNTNPFEALQAILKNRNQLMALGLVIMLNFSGFAVIPFIAKYMVNNVKLLDSQLPYIYFIGGLFTFFTSRIAGRWTDKYNKSNLFIFISIASIIPIAAITNLPPVPLWVALVATTLLFIFNGSRYVPAMAIVTSSVELERRGSFMTISSSFQHMAAGLGSFLAGLIVQENEKHELTHYSWVGVISLAALLICMILSKQIRELKK